MSLTECRPTRLLVATSHRGIVGGVETYLRDLLPVLQGHGFEIAIVYDFDQPGAKIDERSPANPVWKLGEIGTLARISRWKPDVCFLNGLSDPADELKLSDRFPTVYFSHAQQGICISGTKLHTWPWMKACNRKFGTGCLVAFFPCRCGGRNPIRMWTSYQAQRQRLAAFPRYKRIIVASEFMYKQYISLGVPPNLLELVPLYPTDVTRSVTPPAPRKQSHEVVALSRLVPLKGVHLLLDAIAEANTKLSRPLNCTVLGDGPQRSLLVEQARNLRIDVSFRGWVNSSERNEILARADLLGFPSLVPETFGLAGVEAAALGLPAVAFYRGGAKDWLIPGVSGEAASENHLNSSELSAAIVRAMNSYDHWQNLRIGAWQTAGRFTRTGHINKLTTLFKSVAGRLLDAESA